MPALKLMTKLSYWDLTEVNFTLVFWKIAIKTQENNVQTINVLKQKTQDFHTTQLTFGFTTGFIFISNFNLMSNALSCKAKSK